MDTVWSNAWADCFRKFPLKGPIYSGSVSTAVSDSLVWELSSEVTVGDEDTENSCWPELSSSGSYQSSTSPVEDHDDHGLELGGPKSDHCYASNGNSADGCDHEKKPIQSVTWILLVIFLLS